MPVSLPPLWERTSLAQPLSIPRNDAMPLMWLHVRRKPDRFLGAGALRRRLVEDGGAPDLYLFTGPIHHPQRAETAVPPESPRTIPPNEPPARCRLQRGLLPQTRAGSEMGR